MQVQAKTVSALKEKHMAPSKRKQMFDLMKEKGFYKKFPSKHLKKFETWLQSPSGGQLKCPGQIVSEISRFVFLSNMLIVAKYSPPLYAILLYCMPRHTFILFAFSQILILLQSDRNKMEEVARHKIVQQLLDCDKRVWLRS
jgi:protein-S-isoprenylcysteine O-methyltransferase Ste14